MAKSFKRLINKMPQERRETIEDRARGLLLEMAIAELRQSRQLTQQQVAQTLNLNQAALSKMESQTDIRVSTLRRVLSAMGAQLKIVAQFPDGEVIINQFDPPQASDGT